MLVTSRVPLIYKKTIFTKYIIMKNTILNNLSKHCLGLESYHPSATILPRSFDMNVAETNWDKQSG